MKPKTYKISFRCFYPGDTMPTKHYQDLTLKELPKWIEAYEFTHPNCESITVKIWLHDEIEN